MPRKPSPQTAAPAAADDGPAMPFNEALKHVWAAPPAPKARAKTGQATPPKKA